MIEDQELSALFKAESEEHLQSLDEGLLRLESAPTDLPTLESVFRAAHSLKGTARMLGVTDVETIAHHFEDSLGSARRGHTVLTPGVIDNLYPALDAMRKLVREAITGEASGVDVALVLARLSGDAPQAAPEGNGRPARPEPDNGQAFQPPGEPGVTAAPPSQTAVEPAAPPPPPVPEPAAATAADAGAPQAGFKIETIRVEPVKLDALLTLAGEMTVTTTRVARGLAEFDEVSALWDEWSRDFLAHRTIFADGTEDSRSGANRRRTRFNEREHARLERLGSLIDRLKRTTYEDVTRLEFVADELEEAIRGVRLLPFSNIFALFSRPVRDLTRSQSKEVQLLLEGGETTADKRILEEMKDPLMHMVRNAVDHGIELPEERERAGKPRQATLRLRAGQTATNIVIEISDDGRGLDLDAIRRTALKRGIRTEAELAAMSREQVQLLIFAPGFSTSPLVTDVSGRGVGLDVVHTNVERVKGTLEVQSTLGAGTLFRLKLPITVATTRVLLFDVEGQVYALPVEFVQGATPVYQRDLFCIEGRDTICLHGQPVSVVRLADLLQVRRRSAAVPPAKKKQSEEERAGPCIVLSLGHEQLGLMVDRLIDEQEVILKPLGSMLKRVRNVSGATILGTGEVCMVLNPQDLLRSVKKGQRAAAAPLVTAAAAKKVILLAEDSITTRTQEKRILEGAGYEVVTAVDGLDALNKLGSRRFDGVVTDIQMPNMDGLQFAARIRQDPAYRELPIILVTSLASDDDRRRGMEVGANAYITKSAFEQKVLLETLERLVW